MFWRRITSEMLAGLLFYSAVYSRAARSGPDDVKKRSLTSNKCVLTSGNFRQLIYWLMAGWAEGSVWCDSECVGCEVMHQYYFFFSCSLWNCWCRNTFLAKSEKTQCALPHRAGGLHTHTHTHTTAADARGSAAAGLWTNNVDGEARCLHRAPRFLKAARMRLWVSLCRSELDYTPSVSLLRNLNKVTL